MVVSVLIEVLIEKNIHQLNGTITVVYEKLQQWLDFYKPYARLNRWDYESLPFHFWDEKHKDVIACVRNGQSVTPESHLICKPY